VKPARFTHHLPASVDEAVGLLARFQGEDAKLLAGGQSLVPLMNMRLARPKHLVDINGLAELSYIKDIGDGRVEQAGGLAIGALTRHREIERSPDVARLAPLLAEAMPLVGDRQIRFRGTVGGSLAHADPAAEIPTVAAALDAILIVRGADGTREIPASDLVAGYLTTVLDPAEIIVEMRVPPAPTASGFAFLELVRQHGAFAIVSAAAMVSVRDGVVQDARLCLGGVGPGPARARPAEEFLRGKPPSMEVFAEAATLAAQGIDPPSDVHGTAAYRQEMAVVYSRRALTTAFARAPH
jgi:aerobic carbon-monoxide dehydrogenase medium subunit